jgi:hypothetical protein
MTPTWMNSMNDRWRIALHEAGHCVACFVQGGRVVSVAASADCGAADADGLDPTARAFMLAAGPAADELLCDVPPPQNQVAVSTFVDNPPAASLAAHLGACAATGRHGPTDDQQIAAWAIAGCEHDPDRWAPRVFWARHVARRIVTDHRSAIVRLAAELYHRGEMDGADVHTLLTQ